MEKVSVMFPTIAQNPELLKHLEELLQAHRPIFKQERIFERMKALVFGELFAFGRHRVSQILLSLGLVNDDWSAWYRFFSQGRFGEAKANEVLFKECLKHLPETELLVLGGDATQTPRTGKKIEGVGWLRNFRTPPFKVGIHLGQRWFHGSLLLPAEDGYSRALPLRFMTAFTEKARRTVHEARKEWEAALFYIVWVLDLLAQCGRSGQAILFLGDGSYEPVAFWQALPTGVTALLRSAKNRALFYLPPTVKHGNRKYGVQAPSPQDFWQQRRGWQRQSLLIRGRQRQLRYRVEDAFLRKNAPNTPLMLLLIGGETYTKHGRKHHREPVPYLVNAVQDALGNWVLPLPVKTLLFWAWQRWELEVCHRELKSNFGLGEKQAWNPTSAVSTVQFSAWLYSLLLLAGYRTWGLTRAPAVPSPWWRGSKRWSFNTLWRSYRAALWGAHHFQATWAAIQDKPPEKSSFWHDWRNALYSSVRL
jgi:hypothetical protein